MGVVCWVVWVVVLFEDMIGVGGFSFRVMLVVGRRRYFFVVWVFLWVCLSIFMVWWLVFFRVSSFKDS